MNAAGQSLTEGRARPCPLESLRQEMVSKIETGHDSTRLAALYSLFAALNLDMLVDQRSARQGKDIEDVF